MKKTTEKLQFNDLLEKINELEEKHINQLEEYIDFLILRQAIGKEI